MKHCFDLRFLFDLSADVVAGRCSVFLYHCYLLGHASTHPKLYKRAISCHVQHIPPSNITRIADIDVRTETGTEIKQIIGDQNDASFG